MAVNSVTCDDGSIFVNPTTGDVVIHLDMNHTNMWQVVQSFFDATGLNPAAIFYQPTSGTPDILAIRDSMDATLARFDNNANLLLGSNLIVGGDSAILGNPLEVQNAGDLKFSVGPDGEILTNQFEADVTLPALVGRLPIYDAGGTLIGYIPIYSEPTLIIEDDFADSDGTNLEDHTIAPINDPLTSWTNWVGTWGIDSNLAHVTSSVGWDIAACDCGEDDYTAVATCTDGTTIFAAVARLQDGSNYYLAFAHGVSGGLYLYKVVAGTFTPIATGSYTPSSGSKELLLGVVGSALTVKCDGNEIHATDSTFASGGGVGLATYTGTASFSKFTVA